MKVMITGSSGVIGSLVVEALEAKGHQITGFDTRAKNARDRGDILDLEGLRAAVAKADGIVHLAAVSRVAWAERDPERCVLVNATGTGNVVKTALASPRRPWVVFASSREIYGEPEMLPAVEDTAARPINVYGRSKLAGEVHCNAAREAGLVTAVLRLANVYGSASDHPDRVIPAFVRNAIEGRDLRVDGPERVLDFTHIHDTVRGIVAAVGALLAGERALPPMHLLTGRGTSLGRLAQIAVACAGTGSKIHEAPFQDSDVRCFYGDSARAQRLLDWRASITIEDGLRDLTQQIRDRLKM